MDKALTPTVTVVMPVFNAALYLRDAIESILQQTYSDFEFHIIDDGSTDSSVEVIKSYSDQRIVLFINNTNAGIVQTLNDAYARVRSKYIVRMDADDISLPHRLKLQVDFMEENPGLTIAGSWFSIYKNSRDITPPILHNDIALALIDYSPIGHPTTIINRNHWVNANLKYSSEYPHAEDYHCWVNALIQNCKLENIPEILLLYREHIHQISFSKSEIQLQSVRLIKIKYLNYLLRNSKTIEKEILIKLFLNEILSHEDYKDLVQLGNMHFDSNIIDVQKFNTLIYNKTKASVVNIYVKIIQPSLSVLFFSINDSLFYKHLSFAQRFLFPFKLVKKIIFG